MCEEVLPNLFRLKIPLPNSAGQDEYVVRAGDREVAGQVGREAGRTWMYVPASLDEDESIEGIDF